MKLKFDTKDFAENQMIRENFNVCSGTKFSDPFLIQMSLNGKIAVGTDARNLKLNSKAGTRIVTKRVVPLNNEDIERAKACE